MTLWSCGLARSCTNYISTTIVPMTTKHGRMVTCLEGLPTIKSFSALIMWSWKVMWQENHSISHTRVLTDTRRGRMITYLDGLLPIKSFDPFIAWSCEIVWQIKSIISSVQQCLWPPDLAGWWLILRGSYRYSHMIFWLCGLAWSHDQLKTFYFYYCNTCGHQNWQGFYANGIFS